MYLTVTVTVSHWLMKIVPLAMREDHWTDLVTPPASGETLPCFSAGLCGCLQNRHTRHCAATSTACS